MRAARHPEVAANGLRAGSGFTVGLLGAAIGIHASFGISAAAIYVATLAAGIYALRDRGRLREATRDESRV